MRENKLNDMAYLIRDEDPQDPTNRIPMKPLMVDATQDTSLDEESYKLVPCTCRAFDSDTSIAFVQPKVGSVLPECRCFQQKSETLLDAVCTGNLSLLEMCLEEEVNLDTMDEYGNSLLHLASERGDTDMLRFLLRTSSIDLNKQNTVGMTALCLAILGSHMKPAELLLEHGADPNIADNNGKTALLQSVFERDVKMTEMLIQYGADVNAMDVFGNTPIGTALVDKPLLVMIEILLSAGADPLSGNNRLNPFLETVLGCTDEETFKIVKILVEYGVDVNIEELISRRNCLHIVGINGYLPLAEYLVNSGADLEKLDRASRSPYQIAEEHKNASVADFFLKAMLLKRIIHKERLKRMS